MRDVIYIARALVLISLRSRRIPRLEAIGLVGSPPG